MRRHGESSRPRKAAESGVALPATFTPQLATLVKSPPEGDAWLHELKYDGYRIGARIDRGTARLLSRNGKDWTERFAAVRDAVERLSVDRALLDGEIAILLPDGRTSFQALQNAPASAAAGGHLAYFVFDLLHLDGDDISRLPLEERKRRLKRLLKRPGAVLRYADHVVGHGAHVLDEACRQGAEGIVSKRRDAPYQAGRGPTWLKTKCIARQEVVIGGFTDPEGSRAGIGALLIGVYDAGELIYAGKVGTGFSQASARDLRRQLEKLEQREPPFAPPPRGRLGRDAHWVRPQLVAEVAFTEWTADGKIRHPSFQGLRADKRAEDVVRERPQPVRPAQSVEGADDPPDDGAGGREGSQLVRERASRPRPRESAPRSRDRRSTTSDVVVAGVRITHAERELYPDIGLTKLQLAEFYEAIAERILPHLIDRPLTLVRCPKGVGDSCFYMKHSNVWAPAGLRRVQVREKTKVGEYLVADSLTALIGLVQMDVLEIHTWNSTAERLELPDRIVLDLDPGPAVEWPAVIAAARLIRTALEALGLTSFVKTTGGRGLHVVTPLEPAASWSECLSFARAVAEAVVRLDPRAYTTTFAKAGRERQILIDYMRNNRTNTSVSAFSTRARAGAPVSTPLAWDELSARLRSDSFTVRNLRRRLARLQSDPWKAYGTTAQRIPADAQQRLGSVR
jgi:bifunctional non-homologous end joining protein LigD